MKTITLFALLILAGSTANAALLVANNNPGAVTGTNVFIGATALQDAHAAANMAGGDTIYVVPSSVNYGDLVINRGITIFGIGIRPAKDIGLKSIVNIINVDASNVRISGVLGGTAEVRLGWNLLSTDTVNNITIENSRVVKISMSTGKAAVSNLLIRNNVITGGSGSSLAETHLELFNPHSNVLVTNNAFIDSGAPDFYPMIQANGAAIRYNVFIDDGGKDAFNNVDNNLFDHNIFYGVGVNVPTSSTGNAWNFNLSFGTIDTVFEGTLGGNTVNGKIENDDPLFVALPLVDFWNNSYDFSLQAGSPALASSVENLSNEDIGPSGGPTPFVFEGNLLPLIQSINIPGVIPVGTNLPVNIKAKGN